MLWWCFVGSDVGKGKNRRNCAVRRNNGVGSTKLQLQWLPLECYERKLAGETRRKKMQCWLGQWEPCEAWSADLGSGALRLNCRWVACDSSPEFALRLLCLLCCAVSDKGSGCLRVWDKVGRRRRWSLAVKVPERRFSDCSFAGRGLWLGNWEESHSNRRQCYKRTVGIDKAHYKVSCQRETREQFWRLYPILVLGTMLVCKIAWVMLVKLQRKLCKSSSSMKFVE
jgi:hypothetical protein